MVISATIGSKNVGPPIALFRATCLVYHAGADVQIIFSIFFLNVKKGARSQRLSREDPSEPTGSEEPGPRAVSGSNSMVSGGFPV